MKRQIVPVLLMGALALTIRAVSGNGLAPAAHPSAHKITTQRELWQRFFGPVRPRHTLVTGVDAEGLARLLLPAEPVLVWKGASASGVSCDYQTGERPAKRLSLGVGVFASAGAALDALEAASWRASMFPPPVRGVGDMAFGANTTVFVLNSNVLVRLYWMGAGQEETLSAAGRIVEELERGERFVTRGKQVKLPRIISTGLPEQVRLGQEVTGSVVLAGIDPEQALVGIYWDWLRTPHPVETVARPGNPPTITLHVSRDPNTAGEKKFTLVVATPKNVIATKEIRIVVSTQ